MCKRRLTYDEKIVEMLRSKAYKLLRSYIVSHVLRRLIFVRMLLLSVGQHVGLVSAKMSVQRQNKLDTIVQIEKLTKSLGRRHKRRDLEECASRLHDQSSFAFS